MTNAKSDKKERKSRRSAGEHAYTLRMSEALFEIVTLDAELHDCSVNAWLLKCIERGRLSQRASELSDFEVLTECLRRFPGTTLALKVAMDSEQVGQFERDVAHHKAVLEENGDVTDD